MNDGSETWGDWDRACSIRPRGFTNELRVQCLTSRAGLSLPGEVPFGILVFGVLLVVESLAFALLYIFLN